MSEQTKMEVQLANEWFPCEYVSPLDEAQSRVVVYRDDGQFHVVFLDEGLSHRLRPRSPATPATDAEGDGWRVELYGDGLYDVRRFENKRCVEALSPKGEILTTEEWVRGSHVDTLFESRSLALAALAKWREKNRTFTPTPHEPVEGVELRSFYWHGISVAPSIYVDDEVAGFITLETGLIKDGGSELDIPNTNKDALKFIPQLTAFRDRIRAERKPETKPTPFTSEEEARIREIAREAKMEGKWGLEPFPADRPISSHSEAI